MSRLLPNLNDEVGFVEGPPCGETMGGLLGGVGRGDGVQNRVVDAEDDEE